MSIFKKALQHVDDFATQWMKQGNIPGLTVAITSREQPIEVLTHGLANVASKTPVTPSTLFEIGSLGKPFTSIALLQLRDEGKLDLHAPVSQYLPWFQVPSKFPPITVHHLMNHTAGIIRGTERAAHGLYDCWALREIEVIAAPGEYFCYSSLGYKTLGFLLEALTGRTYEDAIRTRVLEPLGMVNTDAVITFRTRERAATGYCGFFDDRPEHPSQAITPAPWQEFGTGDGCQASTAHDMNLYLQMLLNRGQGPTKRVISEESFDMMTLNGIWTGGDFYGYGLATYKEDGRTYVGHGGGNGGFRSAIVVDMEAGLGVVFLLNRMGETDPVVAAAQYALTTLRRAHQKEQLPTTPPSPFSTSDDDPNEYVGTYISDAGELHLQMEGGKLVLDAPSGKVSLDWRGGDRCYVHHPDFALFLLEFKRQGDEKGGKVIGAYHGGRWYAHERDAGPKPASYPPEWDAFVGHYRTRNPELSNFRVVLRHGALFIIIPWGDSQPLHPLSGDNTFRISDDALWPERLRFDPPVQGQTLRVDYSGCPYFRTFTP